jgi:hypothetical protein
MTALLLAGSVLVSAGCYSQFPIDAVPHVRVQQEFLGKWTCRSDDDGDEALVDVTAADEYRYKVSWQDRSRKTEHFEAYASRIGSGLLFNVGAFPKDDSGWPQPWAFVAATVSSGVLRIQLAGQKAITGQERSPEEVQAALNRASGSSEFLDDPLLCDRATQRK